MARGPGTRQAGGMNSNPRTLTRSTTDRKLGGVAGGLAAYFGADPILFRVGFAFVTIVSGGAGALAYLALLAFVPNDDEAPAGVHPAPA